MNKICYTCRYHNEENSCILRLPQSEYCVEYVPIAYNFEYSFRELKIEKNLIEKSCSSCKHCVPKVGCGLDVIKCLTNKHNYPFDYNLWKPIETTKDFNNFIENSSYRQIAKEIAELVIEKQKAYGNSFGEAESFLKLLYPNGVSVEKYKDMLTLVRIWDKIKRIATDKEALGESPYNDIMGYCLLALNELKQKGMV